MVVSGVNDGSNLGDDVLYSGTVAAATEGRFLGKAAVAVSLHTDGLRGDVTRYFETGAHFARVIVERLSATPLTLGGRATILNVNVPNIPVSAVKGIKVTRLGNRHRSEALIKAEDPRGRPVYWVGPRAPARMLDPVRIFTRSRKATFPSRRSRSISPTMRRSMDCAAGSDPTREREPHRRHRHDLRAHARPARPTPARAGHHQPRGAGPHPQRAAAHLHGRSAGVARLRRHRAADWFWPNHFAALHRGAHDRSAASKAGARSARCSRSARAAATRRPCSRRWS